MSAIYNPSCWYRERAEKWVQMFRAGMTINQIAERYDMTRKYVKWVLENYQPKETEKQNQ